MPRVTGWIIERRHSFGLFARCLEILGLSVHVRGGDCDGDVTSDTESVFTSVAIFGDTH